MGDWKDNLRDLIATFDDYISIFLITSVFILWVISWVI